MSAYDDLVIADGVTAYLKLGEASGTSAVDAKGGTSWTYKNSPVLGVAGVPGDADTAITVNGVTNFRDVNLAAVPMTAVNNWTLEAWVLPGTQNDAPCTIVWIGTQTVGYGLVVDSTNHPRGFYNTGSGLTDAPASALSTSVWSHVVLRRSSGVSSVWVNGVQADPGTNNTGTPSTPTTKSCIGARADSDWFYKGSIYKVGIYNTALSDATILAHYNEGISTGVEEHSGTASLTGAGSVVPAGAKQGKSAQTLTGAGSATPIHTTARSTAQTLTGAGAFTATITTARSAAIVLTGAGVLTYTGGVIEAHAGTAVLTGAGALTVTITTGRAVSVTLTGAGSITLTTPAEALAALIAATLAPVHTFSYELWVQWDGVTWVDETAFVLSMGGPESIDPNTRALHAAEVDVELDNSTGRYDPDNAAGPLYSSLTHPGQKAYIKLGYNGNLAKIGTYWIDDLTPVEASKGASLRLLDRLDKLSKVKVNYGPANDVRLDDIARALLVAAGLTEGEHFVLDVAETTAVWAVAVQANPVAELADIAVAEGGRIYVDPEGVIRFLNRTNHRALLGAPLASFVRSEIAYDLSYARRQVGQISRVNLAYEDRVSALVDEIVYDQQTPIALPLATDWDYTAQMPSTVTPTGLTTTLSADTLAGATSIVLADATGLYIGQLLRVGDPLETEIAEVADSYAGGTTVPTVAALTRNHDSTDPVVKVDADDAPITPSGLSTTLTADVAAAATSIEIADATNIYPGKFLRLGDPLPLEMQTMMVGAGYVSGLTIPLVSPLFYALDSGDPVVMVDSQTNAVTSDAPITVYTASQQTGWASGVVKLQIQGMDLTRWERNFPLEITTINTITANSAADGSGSAVTVIAGTPPAADPATGDVYYTLTANGPTAEVVLYSLNHATTTYITVLKVNGKPARQASPWSIVADDHESQDLFGVIPQDVSNAYLPNADVAMIRAQDMLFFRSGVRTRVDIPAMDGVPFLHPFDAFAFVDDSADPPVTTYQQILRNDWRASDAGYVCGLFSAPALPPQTDQVLADAVAAPTDAELVTATDSSDGNPWTWGGSHPLIWDWSQWA